MESKSVFATLNALNCNEHTEKKGQLTYLSWAWAWQMVKQNFPDATYTIYETAEGRPYFDDGRTAWVKTGVSIQGIEHIEYLPIMDYSNRSIPVDKIVSTDVNKTIQRSLTKACARHGLGLYIYAGEDLPDVEMTQPSAPKQETKPEPVKQEPAETATTLDDAIKEANEAKSGKELTAVWNKYKEQYGLDSTFVLAISKNPNNPKKRG